MLGFILSRMLNPLSYLVFILFFAVVSISAGGIIPKVMLEGFANVMSPFYLPLLMTSILAHIIIVVFLFNFIYRVIIEGRYIVKLSALGLLIALSIVQTFTFFCMNALPVVNTPGRVEVIIKEFIRYNALGYFELISLLLTGILLSLYVGILGRAKFKKNIGFIDDTI